MHINPRWGRSHSLRWQTACLILLTASPLLAADSEVTFLVTSDSHYDAFENEDRNERDRVTIDQMNAIASVAWPDELGGDSIGQPQGVLLLGDVIDDGDRMKDGKNQVLPLAHDQAGVINQVTVEVLRISAVFQRRVGGKAFPGTIGRIGYCDADFGIRIEALTELSGGARVKQPVASLGNENVGREDAGSFPATRLAFRESHSSFRPCVTIRRNRVPDCRIVARGNLSLRIPNVIQITDLDDIARTPAHHACLDTDALRLRIGRF